MSQNTTQSAQTDALPLRLRLAGALGLILLAGAIALYYGANLYARTAADRSYDRVLAGAALSIAETLSVVDGTLEVDVPYAALDMLSAAPDDRVFYSVVGPNGVVATGYDDLPRISNSTRGSTTLETRFFTAPYRGEQVRFALLGRQLSETTRGLVWVQVGQTRVAREALQRELVLGAIAPLAGMIVIVLGFVWFGIGRALAPIRRIGHELSARGPTELTPLHAPTPSEMAPLVVAINGFMERLATNIDTLRTFIAEAAHQLRTPLAALRAQAQVAMDGDEADMRRGIEAVERNASKLSRLLDQLLSHATVIHRADAKTTDLFDLIDVAHEAVHETLTFTSNANIHIEDTVVTAPIHGDPILVREAIKNLLDNALRYGRPDKDAIEIGVSAVDDGFVVRVCDRGPGLSDPLRERVFERFTRGARELPGAGLGLHIVRRAATSHNGHVSLADRPGGGLIAEITLPRTLP